MPIKTSKNEAAAALPSILKELIDQMVRGPIDSVALPHAATKLRGRQTMPVLRTLILYERSYVQHGRLYASRSFCTQCLGAAANLGLGVGDIAHCTLTFRRLWPGKRNHQERCRMQYWKRLMRTRRLKAR